MSSITLDRPQERPTPSEMVAEGAAWIAFVFVAGPPVLFLVGPLLVLVLGGLVWPFALLFALAAACVAVAAALALAGTLVASPYLLVRHVRARLRVRANLSDPS